MEDVAIDISDALMSMGADSLVAIDNRNWWKQALAVDINVLELADKSNTMELLGALEVERLNQKFHIREMNILIQPRVSRWVSQVSRGLSCTPLDLLSRYWTL